LTPVDIHAGTTMTPTPRLPDAEQDVLAALYELGEATVRQLRTALARRRPLAHSSVVTLLARLEARGLVRRRKGDEGKAFFYRPTRARQRAFGPLVRGLMQRAFRGRPVDAVVSLFETAPPTEAEIDELQALVDRLRRSRPPSREDA
jgi:BlaI family transcriptional regulator, penicillinase repressor